MSFEYPLGWPGRILWFLLAALEEVFIEMEVFGISAKAAALLILEFFKVLVQASVFFLNVNLKFCPSASNLL